MDYKTLTTPEIIKAILARDSVADTVKNLIRAKENELSRYKDALTKEEESTRRKVQQAGLLRMALLRNCENATLTLRRQRMNELRRRKKRKRKHLTAFAPADQRRVKGGD